MHFSAFSFLPTTSAQTFWHNFFFSQTIPHVSNKIGAEISHFTSFCQWENHFQHGAKWRCHQKIRHNILQAPAGAVNCNKNSAPPQMLRARFLVCMLVSPFASFQFNHVNFMSKCNGSNLDCQLKNHCSQSSTTRAVVLHFDSFQHFCHENNNVPALYYAIWIVRAAAAAALLVGLLPSDIVCILAQSVHLIHAWPIKCRLKWKLTIMPASKLHWLKLINQA